MENPSKPEYDLLAAGELLIDFISTDFADHFNDVRNFTRFLGGSPANLCMNMSRLGNRTLLAATLGQDDMGEWLRRQVAEPGVDCRLIRQVPQPTTLILVTRSRTVSNFVAYRSADNEIADHQFPSEVLRSVRLFHTTCFGLSRQPAQAAIIRAARRAVDQGCQLSMDANYAEQIWPDRKEAQSVVAEYCGLGALMKVSEVDWERLYGVPLKDAATAARHFLDLGARQACITLGGEGAYAASAEGEHCFLPARPVEVRDTTGAGDAFWSGYLTAWLDGLNLEQCLKAGRRMAEMKLTHFGPLPPQVDRRMICKDN